MNITFKEKIQNNNKTNCKYLIQKDIYIRNEAGYNKYKIYNKKEIQYQREKLVITINKI